MDKIIIHSVEEGVGAASRVTKMLEGKKFDVVSYHSAHQADVTVLEEASLKSSLIVISDTLIKIPLSPRRSLCFDINGLTVVIFESERQIRIERKLVKDTLTRIILVN